MKHEIRFKGLSLDRDELASQHGELALCGNMEIHDGALRPSVLHGTELGDMKVHVDGETIELIHIHAGSGESYPHYIGRRIFGNRLYLYWFRSADANGTIDPTPHNIYNFGYRTIYDVKSIGNTLCVMLIDGIHYFLFKDEGNNNERYDYLGQMPELEMRFGIKLVSNGSGDIKSIENTRLVDTSHYHYDQATTENILEDDQPTITQYILAGVNKAVNERHEAGYFVFPFFVRYALRLFDGSIIRHSAPILMMPSGCVYPGTPASYDGSEFRYHDLPYNTLTYIADSEQISSLQSWNDIVKSIDIFISAPIYTYDQSGLCKRLLPWNYYNEDDRAFSFHSFIINGSLQYGEDRRVPYTNNGVYKKIIELPQFDASFSERIESVSNFFLYRSIPIADLRSDNAGVEFEPKSGDLTNITTKQQMTDDYDSHDLIKPTMGYVYNSRLNLYGITKQRFRGFHPVTCFNLANIINDEYVIHSFVHIGDTVVEYYNKDLRCTKIGLPRWFYYPDPAATKVVWLVRKVEGVEGTLDPIWGDVAVFELDLKPHPMLNGAYWFDGFNPPRQSRVWTDTFETYDPHHEVTDMIEYGIVRDLRDLDGDSNIPDSCKPFYSVNTNVPLPHAIYTSKRDNPFFFPNLIGESGVNSVGSGTIIGIAAVTRALSTGQVGQHDLMVFATDGIWVMKVSSTGTYSELHNISRDVCVNPQSICQLDQSVIFANDRSLARFVESDGIPISDALDGPVEDFAEIMPEFYQLFDVAGVRGGDGSLKSLLDFGTPATDYFREGRVIYDYESQRLLVLPSSLSAARKNIAFVFSIQDQTWSTMMTPSLLAFIPGYPTPYYQDGSGMVYRLDKPYPLQTPDPAAYYEGIVITRTLAFSDTMDVIRSFQQLSNCSEMPLMYFYGSNDQRSWHLIGYSQREFCRYMPGRPYRYMRIAMYFSMTLTERYQELLLEIVNKYAKL